LANEYVGDITIPNQVLQADQPIRLQYSHQIKLVKKLEVWILVLTQIVPMVEIFVKITVQGNLFNCVEYSDYFLEEALIVVHILK